MIHSPSTDIVQPDSAPPSPACGGSWVDDLADPVFVFDALGRLAYVNREGAAILGFLPEEVFGKTFTELGLPEPFLRSILDWSKPAFALASSMMFEKSIPTVDGSRIYEILLKRPRAPGTVPLVIACLRDITDRKRAEAETRSLYLREFQARRKAELELARQSSGTHPSSPARRSPSARRPASDRRLEASR